jgi:hypothetical protein
MAELPYWYRRRKRILLPRDAIADHAASLLRLCVFAERMITVTPSYRRRARSWHYAASKLARS